MRRLSIVTLTMFVLGLVGVVGAPSANAAVGVEVVGLRDDGTTLVRFDSALPGTILASTPVTGLGAGETVLGLDFRPATAQLHALTSAGRVAVVDPRTGAIVRSVTLAADPADVSAPFTTLAGTQFGVDFNPVPDRLRVVSDTGQNLRINVDTGSTTTDTNLNPGTPGVTGAAYTNSTANPAPATTQLFDIDPGTDRLVLQNPPNDGTLVDVGPLGVDADGRIGFDIDAASVARASLTVGGSTGLYTIDLTTGAATLVGTIGTGTPLRGIAVAPAATPPVVALLDATSPTLRFVDPRNTASPLGTVAITGLTAGDTLVGIDVRPATGALYALGINGATARIYTISTATGTATLQATVAADPADLTNPYTGISGTTFAVDFNPVPDRLRVVSDTDQNLRINVTTGLATTDGPIAYAGGDPNAAADAAVSAAAYTSSTNPAPLTTTLIDIETNLDVLAVQNPPNDGTLLTGGSLGTNLPALVSFDISPDNRWALLASGDAATARLGSVDLGSPPGAPSAATGRRALFGAIGATRGIAVLTPGAALPPALPASTPSRTVIGLNDAGTTLISFDAAVPGTITATVPIAGLQAGETVVGIDHRPATSQLFALTSAGRLVVLNPATGAVQRTVTLAADPADATAPYTSLSGTSFGVDFNPVPDRLRVVSDTGQNLRINVDNGFTTTDTNLNPGTPSVTGAAYTNSTANPAPATTQLYDIDSSTDRLLLQNPPNDGTLAPVGPLGVDTDSRVGFDIDGPANSALAALTVGGTARLYTIDLLSGSAALVGTIGTGIPLRGISVTVVPPPRGVLLVGQTLRYIDVRDPGTTLATSAISGISAGDTLVGIDVRPATGALTALGVNGTSARIYTINTATGAATLQATVAADPADLTNPYAGISGTTFAVDFNPVPDRLRVISDTDQNLRINVATGLATTDGPIAYIDGNAAVNPTVGGAAYTNSTNPAPLTTTLIDIETSLDVLAVQNPPNNGSLTAGGPLGADLAANASFDISPDNRWAVLTSVIAGATRLDSVELGTPIGSATAPAGRRALFGTVAANTGFALLPASTTLPPQSAPVAVADTYTANEDQTLTVAAAQGVLANDTDAEGSPLTAGSASDPAGGSVTLAADGSFTYTSDASFSGTDTFTYVVSDGNGGTATGTVTITVTATNGSAFHPLTPNRILDTRPAPNNVGPFSTPFGPGTTRDVTVTGGNVPAGADAVTLNVTVTDTTGAGYLTIWPSGQAQPVASNLNWAAGQTIPNAVTVKVGAGGRISIANPVGSTQVIIDIVGYYDGQPGDGYTPLDPARILDSRPAPNNIGPFGTAWGPGETRQVPVTGIGGVPANADAVVLNATVTGTTAASYLTIWPNGQARPLASSLNWAPGDTIPNAVTVKVGAGGLVSVFNQVGNTHVIFDVVGYFAAGTGHLYHPLNPARVLDTRPPPNQVGPYTTPWPAATNRDVQISGNGGVPAGAAAALLNVTVTGGTASSFLSIFPGPQPTPPVSSLNWVAGQTIPNSVTTKLTATGAVTIRNQAGTVHVIADTNGWYG